MRHIRFQSDGLSDELEAFMEDVFQRIMEKTAGMRRPSMGELVAKESDIMRHVREAGRQQEGER